MNSVDKAEPKADPVNNVVKSKLMGRLKVQSMNVRGLSTKVLDVDAFLQLHSPDIFFIQEADLAKDVTVNFDGYTTFYSDHCFGDKNKARTLALVKSSTGLAALPPSSCSTRSPSRSPWPTAARSF